MSRCLGMAAGAVSLRKSHDIWLNQLHNKKKFFQVFFIFQLGWSNGLPVKPALKSQKSKVTNV